MKKIYVIFALMIVFVMSGCEKQSADSDKPKVYASFYAMNDFARMIGGDNIDLTCMVPSGAEPHDWEPSVSDIAALEKADVFIYSGSNMEHWTESVLPTLSNKELKVICLSDFAPMANNTDPHIWLDPDNLISFMESMKNAFSDVDPGNKDIYNENYLTYNDKIIELLQSYLNAALNFKSHDIVVAHEAYGYMCNLININQIAIEGLAGESDPSPARMAEIIKEMKDKNIKYIFTEPGASEKVIESIAAETGAQILELSPFESDTQNRDYFTVMEANLAALKTALD